MRNEDMTPDEAADQALHGMAKCVISEEKAEIASNSPDLDLKVDTKMIPIDDNTLNTSSDHDESSNPYSTPVDEVHFGLSNPQDNRDNVLNEQDKILKHQQEIENLAVSRSSIKSESQEIQDDYSSLHKIAGEIETDQIIASQEN